MPGSHLFDPYFLAIKFRQLRVDVQRFRSGQTSGAHQIDAGDVELGQFRFQFLVGRGEQFLKRQRLAQLGRSGCRYLKEDQDGDFLHGVAAGGGFSLAAVSRRMVGAGCDDSSGWGW